MPNEITSSNTPAASTEVAESIEAQEQPTEGSKEANTPAPEPKKNNKKKLKLKIDGEEIEDEVDLDDEEELVRTRQFAKVAQKRIAEKADLEKQVREFFRELKSNPKKILSDPALGLDLDQFAAKIMQEKIENSQKSPEVLKQEELERELNDIKAERDREREEKKKLHEERLQEQAFQEYDTMMTEALSKTDLPKSEYVVSKIAQYMIAGLNKGKKFTPEEVIPHVRADVLEELNQMFQVMPEEVIEKMIGKDKISKLRKKSLAKAPPVPVAKAIPDSGATKEKPKEKGQKQSFRQYFGV